MSDPVHVVVDIGGTNTRVGLCRGAALRPDTIRRFRNADHPGLAPILIDYLRPHGTPEAICIDMAGPVADGVGTLTNLDWRIDHKALEALTGAARVLVLNDLQAQGHAVAHLTHEELVEILPGRMGAADVRLVINVGTGLNAVPVYSHGALTLVPPAEAGHISLQARDAEELRLLDWMQARHGTPGLEDVLSGRGLERLYAFVCHDEGTGTPRDAAGVMQAFAEAEPQAHRAARLFTRHLARYAGDLALCSLPTGGVFLVGGVMRHLGPHLLDLGFAEGFADKGRFSDFLRQFPVHLVADDYAALRGCAGHLSEVMAR